MPSCSEQENLLQMTTRNIQLEVRNYIKINVTEKDERTVMCIS